MKIILRLKNILKTPKLSIEDSMKIGNAMREIGYGDSDVDEYREELRFENIEEMYSNV